MPREITKLATPCREYRGPRHKFGYGFKWFRRADGARYKTTLHRWVWEQIHGPLPTEIEVLHKCDNPPCFVYDHLFTGTKADNMADMNAKGRHHTSPMPHGEDFTCSKLTDAIVIAIRRRAAAGVPQTRLAREYGVGTTTIGNVVHRRTWRHVS